MEIDEEQPALVGPSGPSYNVGSPNVMNAICTLGGVEHRTGVPKHRFVDTHQGFVREHARVGGVKPASRRPRLTRTTAVIRSRAGALATPPRSSVCRDVTDQGEGTWPSVAELTSRLSASGIVSGLPASTLSATYASGRIK
jgi:hypothetical protein